MLGIVISPNALSSKPLARRTLRVRKAWGPACRIVAVIRRPPHRAPRKPDLEWYEGTEMAFIHIPAASAACAGGSLETALSKTLGRSTGRGATVVAFPIEC